jgi:hypothetical protein
VVHPRQRTRRPANDAAHKVQEQPVHEMRLVAAAPYRRAEVDADSLASVFDNVRAKDCVEYDATGFEKPVAV